MIKLVNDENVTVEVLAMICTAFNYKMDDIMEQLHEMDIR